MADRGRISPTGKMNTLNQRVRANDKVSVSGNIQHCTVITNTHQAFGNASIWRYADYFLQSADQVEFSHRDYGVANRPIRRIAIPWLPCPERR